MKLELATFLRAGGQSRHDWLTTSAISCVFLTRASRRGTPLLCILWCEIGFTRRAARLPLCWMCFALQMRMHFGLSGPSIPGAAHITTTTTTTTTTSTTNSRAMVLVLAVMAAAAAPTTTTTTTNTTTYYLSLFLYLLLITS